MDQDDLNILIFGHSTFGVRRLRIGKNTFNILFYLLIFFQIAVTFFFCDYIQIKRNTFLLNQLRSEALVQRFHIQLFSTQIEDLEKQLSKLKDMDRRIRIIASLEKGQETTSLIGVGGTSPSVMTWPLKQQPKGEIGQ